MDAITIREYIDLGELLVTGGIALILIIMSAMASGSEVAFFSLTHNDIDKLESRSDAGARRVLELLKNSDRLLATILVTNNLVNICLVILATQFIDMIFIFSGIYDFLFKTVVVTFLLLLFGEIMPKVLSQTNPMRMSLFLSMPMKVARWVVYPFATILMRTSSHVSRIASKSAEISIEELADAVDLAEAGSEEEQKMLSGIITFGQTEVVEIMCSRVDITGLEYEANYE